MHPPTATTRPTLTTFASYSSSSSSSHQQQGPPVSVNLARPKCFCGFTSVSVYPEPLAAIHSGSKVIQKANWVYECHFTPKQRGMVKPDTCEDCEEDRQRMLVRAKTHAFNSNGGKGVKSSIISSSSSGGISKRHRSPMRHKAERVDQVEFCPTGAIYQSPPPPSSTKVGADIRNPVTFMGLAATDGLKVCGFHMHALEWHHMQTIGVESILVLAKQTGCEVFNFSVVRWLGGLTGPSTSEAVAATSRRTTIISNSNTHNHISSTTTSNNNSGNNNNTATTPPLSMKLFRKISCACRRESVIGIAQKPFPATSTSSLLSTTPTPKTQAKGGGCGMHYMISCRGRAYLDPSFKIIEPRLIEDPYYGHFNRTWVKPDGSILKCSFCITIDRAIFQHTAEAIHKWIPINPWLSQWFPSPSPVKSLLHSVLPPVPASRPPVLSRVLTSSATRVSPGESGGPGTYSPRLTEQMVSTIQRSLNIGDITTPRSPLLMSPLVPTAATISPSRSTSITPTALVAPSATTTLPPLTTQDVSRIGQQVIKKPTKSLAGLKELDRELENTVTWHVAEVTSIMGPEEGSPWSPSKLVAPDECEYTNYLAIEMEEMYPGIAMNLCQRCKEHARDFCVVPLYTRDEQVPAFPTTAAATANSGTATITAYTWKNNNPSPHYNGSPLHSSPLPESPAYSVDTDAFVELGMDLSWTDTELERVDRELEQVMERHAETVLELLEARSRLVPGLVLCRGCEYYHAEGRDVLPCSHALMCMECVRRVEFYLVPRANSSSTMLWAV